MNDYYNDVFEINPINLAIVALRLSNRFVTIMNFGGNLATMNIQNNIDTILDRMKNDVLENHLKEIHINDYLPEFDYSNQLNDELIEYIELCLERERLE